MKAKEDFRTPNAPRLLHRVYYTISHTKLSKNITLLRLEGMFSIAIVYELNERALYENLDFHLSFQLRVIGIAR